MSSKNEFLQIRVTPAQKAVIRAQAEQAGMDMSSYVLGRLIPAPRADFQALVAALSSAGEKRRYALAALNDFLAEASAREFAEATAEAPADALDAYLANYVAAMIETAAHRLGVSAPDWTQAVAPLAEPRFGSALPGLRLHLLTHSPPAFRRRNIFIDSTIGSRV
jgi:hypothetical protein